MHRNIGEMIDSTCTKYMNKDFIRSIDEGTSITFGEFDDLCDRIGSWLSNICIKKALPVSVIGKNSINTIAVFFAVLKYGATLNPIYIDESINNVKYILNLVQPALVVIEDDYNTKVIEKAEAHLVRFSELFANLPRKRVKFESAIKPKGIAEYVFTSGTTKAIPKGVAHSHEGLLYMTKELVERLSINDNDRILDYRAYNWMSVQLLSIFSCMMTGATLILAGKFSRSRFPGWLSDNAVTISAGVPTVINMLLKKPVPIHKRVLPSLRFITSSSAPLTTKNHKEFEEKYGIHINQMMGMTEAGWIAANLPEDPRIGTVGKAMRFKEVLFVNEMGKLCRTGEEGEMVVKGLSMGLGYLKEGKIVLNFPKSGMATGDLGHIDKEGYIYITGRKKELIIRGGINISPEEITECLMKNPMVIEAATIGVPDEIYGEEIASFVVIKKEQPESKEKLREFCVSHLPSFKVPRYILILDNIPKTVTGKVSREGILKIFKQKVKEVKP